MRLIERGRWPALVAGLLLLSAASAQDRAVVSSQLSDLERLAASEHRAWTVRSIEVEGRGLYDFELNEVEVFAPGSRIVVNDGDSDRLAHAPSVRYYRGHVAGMPDSGVALTVTPQGDVRGLVNDGLTTWEIGTRPFDTTLEASRLDTGVPEGVDFSCGASQLPDLESLAPGIGPMQLPDDPIELSDGELFSVTIAIETDYEFYQLFGSAAGAVSYIGDLFNYLSLIYEDEVQARFQVGDVFLWSTPDQPWEETGSLRCRLFEFGRYWRDERAAVERSAAHFLSGRNMGGGIAWQNTLCRSPTSYSEPTGCASVGSDFVAGDFGVSGGISGTYETSSGIAWDGIVVAHELGHTFGSGHTHCYGGSGGTSSPVDACFSGESGSGCWSGNTALPGIDALSGGAPGERTGTIMSYCHQQAGGLSNMAASFGREHPFGVSAERVPDRMSSRVASVAAASPSCIPVVDASGEQTVALDVSTSGTGQGTVTSDPGGIDCGSSCSANFPVGETVTLTATPAPDSLFDGWGGDCSGGGACTLTMDQARTVTAFFLQEEDPGADDDPGTPDLDNGDFSDNDGEGTSSFAHWQVASLVDDQANWATGWFVQTGTSSPINGFEVPPPPRGAYAAMADPGGPGAQVLSTGFEVPAEGGMLTFDLYLHNHAADYYVPVPPTLDPGEASPNQQFRADLVSPNAAAFDVDSAVLANIYQTRPGDPQATGYRRIEFQLDPFAGQHVELRFAHVSTQDFFVAGVDNVRLYYDGDDSEEPNGDGQADYMILYPGKPVEGLAGDQGSQRWLHRMDVPISASRVLFELDASSGAQRLFRMQEHRPVGEIVGGADAAIEDHPWQVALMTASGSQYCGGSIVGERWVVTAAHCLFSRLPVIRAGVSDKTNGLGQDIHAVRQIPHPDYDPATDDSDIALLELREPLDFRASGVAAIEPVADDPTGDQLTAPGTPATITGWGAVAEGGEDSAVLQEATVPIVSDADAHAAFSPYDIPFTDNMLAAGNLAEGGVDACQGDSGGPLIVPSADGSGAARLAGVTSWGVGCARPEFPGVYTRVSRFSDWIEAEMAAADEEPGGEDAGAVLYVRRGAPPSLSHYDCKAGPGVGQRACVWDDPEPGAYYLMIHGETAYSDAMLAGSYLSATWDRAHTPWAVAEIYAATLGYAPDAEGLDYWVDNIRNIPEWTPTTVAQSFFDQPGVQAEYPDHMGHEPLIQALYQNIFGRAADAEGLQYWLTELQAGRIARNEMIISLLNGGWANPLGTRDMAAFGHRIEVSLAFVDYQRQNGIVLSELSPDQHDALRDAGEAVLAAVTADPDTVAAALALIPELLDPVAP